MQHNLQIIMTSKKTVPLFADLQKTRVKFFFQNENNNWITAVFGGCVWDQTSAAYCCGQKDFYSISE